LSIWLRSRRHQYPTHKVIEQKGSDLEEKKKAISAWLSVYLEVTYLYREKEEELFDGMNNGFIILHQPAMPAALYGSDVG